MTSLTTKGRSAATAVIVRDMPDGPPHILMMERAGTMAFAAGALVFPGGAVDDADRELARAMGGSAEVEETAARLAAIRETLEESGLGIGFAGVTDPVRLAEMRRSLAAGLSLSSIIDAHGTELALDQLVPFSRWHPADAEMAARIYDTRFYLVRAPAGQIATADATENVRLFWMSARDTIALCDAGEGRIIFPTRRNLERLALFDSFADMAAHAASFPVEKVSPWLEERDGVRHLCIPDHLGYPVTSEPMEHVQRG
ncbi:MAG TPA: NUDIX hydrolase [Sphingobium sp.]|nr:NUDIX hydrolase [Sphingobium sp.]